jgi:hypothetical protein
MSADRKIANVAFDDSQIASTPIECVEGFQISDCWWVTGNPEVRRAGVPENLIKQWLGHSQNLLALYAAQLQYDVAYRRRT